MYEIFDIKDNVYVINYFSDHEFKCTPKILRLNKEEFESFKVGKKEV